MKEEPATDRYAIYIECEVIVFFFFFFLENEQTYYDANPHIDCGGIEPMNF